MIQLTGLTFLFILYSQHVFCCQYSVKYKTQTCDSFDEVAVEANDNWTALYVWKLNDAPLITLTAQHLSVTPNLTELIIHGWLKDITPGVLNALTKLDKLTLFDNNLPNISASIFDDLNIRNLSLTNNSIQVLPKGIFNRLSNLKQLNIDQNNIKTITTGVFNGTLIIRLFLIRNGIEMIENGAFTNMLDLTLLSLAGNYLKSFNTGLVLSKNSKLYYLWLTGNRLTNITMDMLDGLPVLEYLLVGLNRIETIEVGTFGQHPKLKYLDISNNRLSNLQADVFPLEAMMKLRLFYVHNNRLTFISPAVFARMPTLEFVTYGGNPFQCPCLQQVERWVTEKNIMPLCDDAFKSGDRPTCVRSNLTSNVCLYDVDLSQELYDLYRKRLAKYPELGVRCDTTYGANAAMLIKSQWKRY